MQPQQMTTNKAHYAGYERLRDNSGTLATLPCDCGQVMGQVIHAELSIRVGWYCPSCRSFTKAIGRERLTAR